MNDSEKPEEERKLHIDSDWKEQVQAEKEKLKQAGGPAEEPAAESTPQDAASQAGSAEDYQDPQLPPASLMTLVSMLATESLMALGQFRDPATNQPFPPRLNTARHLIDTLDILREKTKGNLSPDEEKMLEDTAHQLRMAYIELSK